MLSTDSVILERIEKFKLDLPNISVSTIVRRHITFGDCYILNEDKHFILKAEIADHFGLHPSEVLVVGSGKLGFTIKPAERYRGFSDTSDIDVAIISGALFDEMWRFVFDYSIQTPFFPQKDSFVDYLLRGWIRPDKLPPSERFPRGKDWWEFFRKLTSSGVYGPYPIKAGLYKSWHFLEAYQSINVSRCQQAMRKDQ